MARRCPVAATGKRGGSCLGTVVPGMKARQPGDGWRVGDEICSAYCCKLAAGLGPDLERERERKRCKSYGTCSSTSFSLRGAPADEISCVRSHSLPCARHGSGNMAMDVAAIRSQLQLDRMLSMAAVVQAANAELGLQSEGPLAKQVQLILIELGYAVEQPVPASHSDGVSLLLAAHKHDFALEPDPRRRAATVRALDRKSVV